MLTIFSTENVGHLQTKQLHPPPDARDLLPDELLTLLFQYCLKGIVCNEVAYAALVVDNTVCSQFLIATHHRVRVYLVVGTQFTYRCDSVTRLQFAAFS